jgi:hypothetical protein
VAGVGGWYSVAPDCVKNTGDLGSGFENIAKPFQDCTGYFTFGPGTAYEGAPGQPVAHGASTALWIITAIGFLVSIGFIVAWVWFENSKLWAQTMLLRAGGGMPAPGGVPPGPGPSQPPLAGPSTEPGE